MRQMAPPIVTLTLLLSTLFSLLALFLGYSYLPGLAIIVSLTYLIALTIGCYLYSADTPLSLIPGIILALIVMHLSWGSGFWFSLIGNKNNPLS
jgi:hypothetical protein